MTLETKAVGVVDLTVKAVDDDPADPFGSFYCVLSDESHDRDKEVVDAKAFDPLPGKMSVDVDHGLTVASTVGSGIPTYEGNLLTIKGTYSSIDRAQEVRTLVREGHVTMMSVAFINGEREKDQKGVTHVRKAELINATFCPVGVNRNAQMLAAKAMSVKAGRRNSASDATHLQDAHDHLVAAGADCATPTKSVTRKAVVGSYEDRQEDIREAITETAASEIAAKYPDSGPGEYGYLVRIVATFDDRVVYQIGWDDDDDAWQVDYTWDGEEVTLGAPTAVTVDQIVTPSTEAPEGTPAATAAKAVTAGATQAGDEEQELLAQAWRLVAQAAE